jgi:hypothetical protein
MSYGMMAAGSRILCPSLERPVARDPILLDRLGSSEEMRIKDWVVPVGLNDPSPSAMAPTTAAQILPRLG